MINISSWDDRRHRVAAAFCFFIVLVVLLSACGTEPGAEASDPAAGPSSGAKADSCISDFDPETDYFADKQELEYAKNFSISYHKSYQVLTVEQPEVGADPESYVLVKCGAPAPELSGELADAVQVTTPVQSIYSGSTTHIPSLEALDLLDLLTGVGTKGYIYSEAAQKRVAQDDVVEYSPAGTVNAEQVVSGKPDVLITAGQEDPAYATIREAGIPVVADAEYLETTPLGTAEWIKFFAALTGTEQQATSIFDGISDDYQAAIDKVPDGDQVEVLLGQPYQGVWSVATGASSTGDMISAAGGSWPWQDDSSAASKQTDLETIFKRAGKTELWVTSSNWTSKEQALKEEPRFAELTAYQSGQLWAPSLQLTENGGNNLFELGTLRADLVVADLVAIIHPEVAPDHEFTFYQQLN